MNTRIKKLRQLLGLKQVELARKLGVADSRIHSWESGATNISRANIKKICTIFGVNPKWLVNGEGDPLAKSALPLSEGDRLRIAREKAGFTQPQLAEQIGRDRTTVAIWERTGKFAPKYLSILSDILRVNQEWLRDGKGEMERDDADVVLKRLYEITTELNKEEKRAILLALQFVTKRVLQSGRIEK